MSQVASEYARICTCHILIFMYLSPVGLFVSAAGCYCFDLNMLSQQFEQPLKVFGSHPSIIKHWDKDCLKNDKLLTLSVIALCCWDT